MEAHLYSLAKAFTDLKTKRQKHIHTVLPRLSLITGTKYGSTSGLSHIPGTKYVSTSILSCLGLYSFQEQSMESYLYSHAWAFTDYKTIRWKHIHSLAWTFTNSRKKVWKLNSTVLPWPSMIPGTKYGSTTVQSCLGLL